MRSILEVGKDIITELIETNKPELLSKLFEVRTSKWKYHSISEECGTIDIFSDIRIISNELGFDLIPVAAEIALRQEGEELFTTALSLLCETIELSETTEMPASLAADFSALREKVRGFGNKDSLLFWDMISNWYRVS